MDEMISTEREYVRSLSYIIEHYFPEMERLDLPQDLRGKRSIIFGNVEKLCDFHGQYFLKELESCAHSPLSISSCFLRHVSPDAQTLTLPRGCMLTAKVQHSSPITLLSSDCCSQNNCEIRTQCDGFTVIALISCYDIFLWVPLFFA